MSEIPADLLYRERHEWVRYDEDGTATVRPRRRRTSAVGLLALLLVVVVP